MSQTFCKANYITTREAAMKLKQKQSSCHNFEVTTLSLKSSYDHTLSLSLLCAKFAFTGASSLLSTA